MEMILLTLGFVSAVCAMTALTLKSLTWILGAIEWLWVWCQDWRDEWRKWEG